MVGVCFLAVVMYVGVAFSSLRASYRVSVATFFPMVVFGAERAFLLVLTKPSSMAEAEAFQVSGDGDEVFDFTHAPLEFSFMDSE